MRPIFNFTSYALLVEEKTSFFLFISIREFSIHHLFQFGDHSLSRGGINDILGNRSTFESFRNKFLTFPSKISQFKWPLLLHIAQRKKMPSPICPLLMNNVIIPSTNMSNTRPFFPMHVPKDCHQNRTQKTLVKTANHLEHPLLCFGNDWPLCSSGEKIALIYSAGMRPV